MIFPLICLLFFLVFTGHLLFKNYWAPGLIAYAGLIASLVNSLAFFFILGSKFSVVGFVSFGVSFFYGLFLIVYFLDFLRKLCKITFLDKNSISLTFKKSLLFSTDFSLPLFIFSSFVSFLAPPYLREFGIFFSVFILIMFFTSTLINFLLVNFVGDNFIKIKQIYSDTLFKKTLFIEFFEWLTEKKKPWRYIMLGLFFSCVGMIIFHFFGLNSFSLFKNNFLINFTLSEGNLNATGKENSTLETVKSALSEEKIREAVGKDLIPLSKGLSNSYLVRDSFDISKLQKIFQEHLKNGFSIQNTSAFNESEVFSDSLLVFLFSLAFISIYIFIRFGLINLINLWINLFLIVFLSFALLSNLRILVNHDIFGAFLGLFSFALFINIFWFNSLSFKFENNLVINKEVIQAARRKVLNIKARESSILLAGVFAFFFSFLWTRNPEFITLNFYLSAAFLLSYFLSQFLILFFWEKLYLFRFFIIENLLKKENLSQKFTILKENPELEEEKIEGINSNF